MLRPRRHKRSHFDSGNLKERMAELRWEFERFRQELAGLNRRLFDCNGIRGSVISDRLGFLETHGICSPAARPPAAAAHQIISGRLPGLGLAAGDQLRTGQHLLHTAACLSTAVPSPHQPGLPLHPDRRHPEDGLDNPGAAMAWAWKPPWPGRALTTAKADMTAGRSRAQSPWLVR